MAKTAKQYLDSELAEHPVAEDDPGASVLFAIVDLREMEPGDINESMKREIIELAIPRLQTIYPWASSIKAGQIGTNPAGWLMHFKIQR